MSSASKVFHYFEEICKIPHGSHNCKEISDYCVTFAKERNLFVRQDKLFNVVIVKEATKGYEQVPTVILQGHLDMVCEKNEDTSHDFLTEPLELYKEGDFIAAKGTTLGGDDGIAIAYCLALLYDDEISHPRLEVLFTVEEEVGMEGATYLDVSELKGKYLINIDNEEEGVLLTSCAGGLKAQAVLPITRTSVKGQGITLKIQGLLGGHSGAEIHKQRANANVLMGRLLYELGDFLEIVNIRGGLKDNAIAREAFLDGVVAEENLQKVKDKITQLTNVFQKEYSKMEDNICIQIEQTGQVTKEVYDKKTKEKTITFLMSALNGVYTMSAHINGLVESSQNLGVMSEEDNKLIFSFAVRSAVASLKKLLSDKIKVLIESLGGTYIESGQYPEWEYKETSKLRELFKKSYETLYQKEMKVEAIHAGLECGIFASKMQEVDIVSFGPDIFDIHTPKERLSISSTERTWELLLHVLKNTKKLV